MQIVFYHLPVRYGLVVFGKIGQQKLQVDNIKVSKSLVSIEEDLDEMIKADEEAKEFDMK